MASQTDTSADAFSGTTTTVVSDQTISPGQKAEEMWTNTQEKADGYYEQAHGWYTAHNAPIRVIPELATVGRLNLGLTVLGLVIVVWIAARFFFGRD